MSAPLIKQGSTPLLYRPVNSNEPTNASETKDNKYAAVQLGLSPSETPEEPSPEDPSSNENSEFEELKNSRLPETMGEANAESRELLFKRVRNFSLSIPRDFRVPVCEIRVKNLSYTVTVPAVEGNRSRIATVASACVNCLCFLTPVRTKERVILDRITATFRPGTMTLLLSPPGSGKTTLLKCLAGRISHKKLTGSIKFNGHDAKNLAVENLVGYISQTDEHLARLTVRETLEFAFKCNNPNIPGETENAKKFRNLKPDLILKMLGLERVADSVVGDQLLRGISGGQRKRVTIGEMLMRPVSVLAMDEISTGLDSATTFDIVSALRTACKVFNLTIIISLLQPSPEVFNLFDDVLLLSKGRVVYHGPRGKVIDYFKELGFEVPFQKDRADFLQDVTTSAGRQYIRSGHSNIPHNVEEFATRWRHSPLFAETAKNLKQKWAPTEETDLGGSIEHHQLSQANRQRFSLGFWEHQKLVLAREWLLTMRNFPEIRSKWFQMIFMGILVGTVFYQISFTNFALRFSVLFFASLFLALGNIANTVGLIRARAIYYKQRAANFYRGGNWVVALLLVQIPFAALDTIILGSLVYWFAGLDSDAGRFFFFLFTMYCLNIALGSYSRCLAAVMPDVTVAQTFSSLTVVLFVIFGGFLITENKTPDYWIWAYWISPISWAIRSLSQNEFHASKFSGLVTTNGVQTTIGDLYLKSYGTQTANFWKWAGIGYLVGFFLITLIIQTLVLEFFRYDQVTGSPQQAKAHDDFDEYDLQSVTGDAKMDVSSKSLPFTPISLSFQDLGYWVTVKKHNARLDLLVKVNGYAKPGRMTALMGESGAGKTTLMDVLAGRKTAGEISGTILVNGFETPAKKFSRVVGYVEQEDIHAATSTIREAFQFSANLRLSETTQEQKTAFVEEVLDLLELTSLADSVIGTLQDGLSTEQRKRVTIGVELVANPALIFLDEPTSGLDSRAAQVVMRVLRNICRTGRTIVCTIHQPSSEIFTLFDDLLLLKRGGKVVYFGPLGDNSDDLIQYFESFPETKKIEAGANPADWMLRVIDTATYETNGVAPPDFVARYLASDIKSTADIELKNLSTPAPNTQPLSFKTKFAESTQIQIKQLMKRFSAHYWRSPNYNFSRFVVNCILAFLFGTVFFQINISDDTGLRSQIALIFTMLAFSGVLNLSNVLPVVQSMRAVYYRERAAKSYSVFPYSMATAIVEVPYVVLSNLIFVAIVYFMAGMKNDVGAFFFFWLVSVTFAYMVTTYGQFLALVFPSVESAQAIGSLSISLWNTFSGFMVPKDQIPNFWIWLYYLSPFRYALNAVCSSQYHCEGADCPTVTATVGTEIQTLQRWSFLENTYNFTYSERWIDYIIILIFLFVFELASYLGLKYVKHINR